MVDKWWSRTVPLKTRTKERNSESTRQSTGPASKRAIEMIILSKVSLRKTNITYM